MRPLQPRCCCTPLSPLLCHKISCNLVVRGTSPTLYVSLFLPSFFLSMRNIMYSSWKCNGKLTYKAM
uniref:Uncharacterized protein n=1 Tax=Uncultured archaeon GZfos26G2 TaxID=3386331 RepID=Q648I1_UNCAG|nr:hypothetical protein GZ37D1_43 [uncultured archaeon GZfos37D1]